MFGLSDGAVELMRDHILFRRGYKYQLAQAYRVATPIFPHADIVHPLFELTTKGQLTVHYAYAWDGPSGPTRDSKSSMRASLIHDVLYQCIQMGLLGIVWRSAIDDLFRRVLREDGMWRWRAWLWWRMVRRLGAGAVTSEREVETAP